MFYRKHSSITLYSIVASIVGGNKKFKKTIELPFSKLVIEVVSLLVRINQIQGYSLHKTKRRCCIIVNLRYFEGKPKLSSLCFISKPSRRVYITAVSMNKLLFKSRFSIFVLSSPHGLISGTESLLLNSGGEIICVLN